MHIKFAVIAILSVRLRGTEQQRSVLSTRHHCLLPKVFHPPKQKLCNSSEHTSFSFPSPWERTKPCCFLSQWSAHILDVLRQWTHVMLVLSRLTSFNIWFPRFILGVPCVRAAFLFTVENSPVYLLFLRLSVSGHVGDFRVLPTVCNAAVKINMQVYRCLFPIILGVQAPHPIFFKFALHLLTFTKDLP